MKRVLKLTIISVATLLLVLFLLFIGGKILEPEAFPRIIYDAFPDLADEPKREHKKEIPLDAVHEAHLIAGEWNQTVIPCGSNESWLITNRQAEIDQQILELRESGMPDAALHPMYIEFKAELSEGSCVPDRCADIFAHITEVTRVLVDPPIGNDCTWPPSRK